MLRITFYNRDKRPGNFSIEELFSGIKKALTGTIDYSDFYFKATSGRFNEIRRASKNQGDINHITGDVNFLAYGLKPSKTILTIHDVGHYEKTLKGLKKIVYKYFWFVGPLKRADYITTISEFTKSRLIYHFGIEATKITVIHNPCPEGFAHSPYTFNQNEPRILQIGSGKTKNINRLIEAVKNINCKLVLIRNEDIQLKNQLDKLGIKYEWHQNLSYRQVQELYKSSDMLYFASEYEGFGIPILEANATGRPVITSNVASMPEVAGHAACIVDPMNVESIRTGILKIIKDEAYREGLILNGLNNINRFSLSGIASQYLKLYQRVAQ